MHLAIRSCKRLAAGVTGFGASIDKRLDFQHGESMNQSKGGARRAFLGNMARLAGAGVVTGWTPLYQIAASAQTVAAALPGFPGKLDVYRQAFRNWSGEIAVSDVWTVAPSTTDDLLAVVNWARDNHYRVRPLGQRHSWAPLTLAADGDNAHLILVDLAKRFAAVEVDASASPARVTAQAGVTLDVLLAALEKNGLGLAAVPAIGAITLGGALAVDAHGAGVPAAGEARLPGHTYGSLSNAVLSLTAVVYDTVSTRYVLRTFARDDAEIGAFLVHLGRAFIIEATLQAGLNQRLQCQSFTDIPASEVFGAPNSAGRSVEAFLQQSGRIEAIWFPFTKTPWLKVWSVKPQRPRYAVTVNKPYNYSFSDVTPGVLADLVRRIVIGGERYLTPLFGQTQLATTIASLHNPLNPTDNIWGWSRSVLQYVRPGSMRFTNNGYAVVTSRANVQRVIHEFVSFYQNRVDACMRRSEYPMNGPLEIRVTGLDTPEDAGPQAVAAQLSALRERPDHPEWNVAIWFCALSLPGTPLADRFYRELEQWMFSNYAGSYATVRPEWSKGWAYTERGPWRDETMIGGTLPAQYRIGQAPGSMWNDARATLNKYDPTHVFSSPLLDQLLP
jgi:FAD/FMN-containing dehydrogenase